MSSSTIHILMTGAGAPGAPGIISCLRSDPSVELTAADADDRAVGKYLTNNFVRVPAADDARFIEEILRVCIEKNIRLIFPLVTKELLHLSRHKKIFEEKGITVLVSSPEAIAIANNKAGCYQFLKERGIEVPGFFIAKTVEDFIHAAFELGHPGQPFCFKPSASNGSRGVRIVRDSLDESDQLFNQKPYHLNITYPHALSILSSKPFPQLIVSEYLPGDEYSVDCLAQHGKMILALPRSREKMINGISVQGEFINDEDIINYCRQIIESIHLHGNIGIQVKRSAGGKPLLLEINPRVQGTTVAAMGAGVNLPLLAVKQALGLIKASGDVHIRWGTRFSRHWTEVFY